jgi:hypothetical protein
MMVAGDWLLLDSSIDIIPGTGVEPACLVQQISVQQLPVNHKPNCSLDQYDITLPMIYPDGNFAVINGKLGTALPAAV